MIEQVFLPTGGRVDSGSWKVAGDSKVFASGTAKVSAFDHARVWASGRTHIWAHGDVRVTATDDARVILYQKSSVVASDETHLEVRQESRARVSGQATAWGWDESRIDAEGRVRVRGMTGKQIIARDWVNASARGVVERIQAFDQSLVTVWSPVNAEANDNATVEDAGGIVKAYDTTVIIDHSSGAVIEVYGNSIIFVNEGEEHTIQPKGNGRARVTVIPNIFGPDSGISP